MLVHAVQNSGHPDSSSVGMGAFYLGEADLIHEVHLWQQQSAAKAAQRLVFPRNAALQFHPLALRWDPVESTCTYADDASLCVASRGNTALPARLMVSPQAAWPPCRH